MKGLSKKILLGITGKTPFQLQEKIIDLQKYKIKKAALFLEFLTKNQRIEVYNFLLGSNLKEIPFVHAKNDMSSSELKFLQKHFKTKFFNVHEDSLPYLSKWKGFYHKILIEFNYNNQMPKQLAIGKLGGFCIDLSHFKASETRWTKEFYYIVKKHKLHKLFKANHLNGYSSYKKKDLHTIKKLKEFDYLKTLPKFVFSKYIALETFNPIKQQIIFKKYIIELLRNF